MRPAVRLYSLVIKERSSIDCPQSPEIKIKAHFVSVVFDNTVDKPKKQLENKLFLNMVMWDLKPACKLFYNLLTSFFFPLSASNGGRVTIFIQDV